MYLIATKVVDGLHLVDDFATYAKDHLPQTALPEGVVVIADADVPSDFLKNYHKYHVVPGIVAQLHLNPDAL